MPSASADSLSFGLICSAGAGSFVLFVCLLMVDDVGGSKHSKSARQAKQAGYTTTGRAAQNLPKECVLVVAQIAQSTVHFDCLALKKNNTRSVLFSLS